VSSHNGTTGSDSKLIYDDARWAAAQRRATCTGAGHGQGTICRPRCPWRNDRGRRCGDGGEVRNQTASRGRDSLTRSRPATRIPSGPPGPVSRPIRVLSPGSHPRAGERCHESGYPAAVPMAKNTAIDPTLQPSVRLRPRTSLEAPAAPPDSMTPCRSPHRKCDGRALGDPLSVVQYSALTCLLGVHYTRLAPGNLPRLKLRGVGGGF